MSAFIPRAGQSFQHILCIKNPSIRALFFFCPNNNWCMIFYRYPEWSSSIRQHYWHLRFARGFDLARIRAEYRRIEAEKKRLYSAGVDRELIRLLCRHMVNLKNQKAERRFWEAHLKTLQNQLEFSV